MPEALVSMWIFLLAQVAPGLDVVGEQGGRVLAAMEELQLRSGGAHHVRFDRETGRRYEVCATPTNRSGDIDLYGGDTDDADPSRYPLSSRNTGQHYKECISVGAGAAGPFHVLVRAEKKTTYTLSIIESR